MQHMHRSSSSRSPAYRELIARMSSPAKRFDPNRTRCGVGACKQVPLLFALGVHPSTPVDYDALRLILSLEATNPNAVDDDGHTALWIASFKGSDAAVEMLLDRAECLDTVEEDGGFVQADCNRPASDGSTPLHAAAYNNSTACIAALVAFAPLRTMDVNARTKGGSTALRAAAHAGHARCVAQLLALKGVDPNRADERGSTPLRTAAYNGHYHCVQALLEAPGVDPNASGIDGSTPLYVAANQGRVLCLELLLQDAAAHTMMGDGGGDAVKVLAGSLMEDASKLTCSGSKVKPVLSSQQAPSSRLTPSQKEQGQVGECEKNNEEGGEDLSEGQSCPPPADERRGFVMVEDGGDDNHSVAARNTKKLRIHGRSGRLLGKRHVVDVNAPLKNGYAPLYGACIYAMNALGGAGGVDGQLEWRRQRCRRRQEQEQQELEQQMLQQEQQEHQEATGKTDKAFENYHLVDGMQEDMDTGLAAQEVDVSVSNSADDSNNLAGRLTPLRANGALVDVCAEAPTGDPTRGLTLLCRSGLVSAEALAQAIERLTYHHHGTKGAFRHNNLSSSGQRRRHKPSSTGDAGGEAKEVASDKKGTDVGVAVQQDTSEKDTRWSEVAGILLPVLRSMSLPPVVESCNSDD